MKRYESLPGTRDFYPEKMRVRTWITERWREVARRYGFEEYDGPVIEPLELFTDKSGEEIAQQLYAFTDRGERRIALRPEMTPSLARMIAARGQGMPKPIKWFSIPRLFRYERPQRGRFREFWQLNLDILGLEGVEADAEIIAAGVDALRACGLSEEDFEVRYSDRRLIEAILDPFGVAPEQRAGVFAALDRLARSERDAVEAALIDAGVDAADAGRLIDIVADESLEGIRESVPASAEIETAVDRVARLDRLLTAYGISEYCVFDLSIVRGLAYYTGVVFEMYDRAGSLRALCGGGRYDGLLEAFGGPDMAAVGFGLGEAVLIELLESKGVAPESGGRCSVYVVPVAEDDREPAIETVVRLRDAGIETDLALRDQSVGKGLKSAAQSGAKVAVLIGERERAEGIVVARDLASGEEQQTTIDDLIARLEPRP